MQFGDLLDRDQLRQHFQLLGDFQRQIGAAGDQTSIRIGRQQAAQFTQLDRRVEALALVVLQAGRSGTGRGELPGRRRLEQRSTIPVLHRVHQGAPASLDNRPITGATAEVAGQRFHQLMLAGAAVLAGDLLVQANHRHDEARRTESALRAAAFDHRGLHRMGVISLQGINADQMFTVQ